MLKDTDNNAADFMFVDTNGTSAGAGQRLGAPGPENLSLTRRPSTASALAASRLDPCRPYDAPPNYVRRGDSAPSDPSRRADELDVRHAGHPAEVHQQHGRAHHAAAVPHHRHHHVPFDLGCG